MAPHRAARSRLAPDRHLVDALLANPAAFPGQVDTVELVETHISWVLLAGEFAYKIKKPVDLGFLDFSTLEKRRFFCEEEVRLNRRWSPSLYLGVAAIVLEAGRPRIATAGDAVEYAVRMRRFDDALRLDHQLEAGRLTAADLRELGAEIAARHADAQRLPASARDAYLNDTWRFAADNFRILEGAADRARFAALKRWSRATFETLEGRLAARLEAGLVRDCHGDLHLGNLVRLSEGIVAFDCIEFDPSLRQTDVICDVAFLTMDLVARERPDLAAIFLNRYLERNGDYEGVTLLDFFFVYRCLVRAKVAAIEAAEFEPGPKRDHALAELDRYATLARRQTRKSRPLLVVMHGLSGSGKTRLSSRLLAALPAVRIRSDIERKRLFGLDEAADSASAPGEGLYTPAAGAAVYARLAELGGLLLGHGHNVILDATFLDAGARQQAFRAAEKAGAAAVLVHADAPADVLRERVSRRSREKHDPSEADIEVLELQLAAREPLDPAESALTLTVDTTRQTDTASVVARIRELAGRVSPPVSPPG